jgi:carbon storage regulator
MLILSRKFGQSIMIGDTVKITLLSQGHMLVKIGIEAPKEIAVHRIEIYEKIQQQQMQKIQTKAALSENE